MKSEDEILYWCPECGEYSETRKYCLFCGIKMERGLEMKAGIFDLKIHNVEGWDLLVPQSFIDATPEEILAKTGGCGPGKIGDWFVPDTMYGESVFLACQVHDWMYGEGKTEEDRFYADMVFDWNMKVLILIHPETGKMEDEILDRLRLHRVTTYFEAVRYGGGSAFESGETMRA